MNGILIDSDGSTRRDPERDDLLDRAGREGFFWLDLEGGDPEQVELIGEAFGVHPLALEDSSTFGQRAKLEPYDGVTFLVLYGATEGDGGLVEVHCFFSERFLVTVHRDPCPPLAGLQRRHAHRMQSLEEPALVLHRVLDALVDSFFPMLARLDERLDGVEDEIVSRPSGEHLRAITAMRRTLVVVRRAVVGQRDVVAEVVGDRGALAGMSDEAQRYFRDVHDHLIRIAEAIDGHRDLVNGAMGVYLSASSNRLGVATKQLTLIATIFLPLAFITGFFGQNFRWMVSHVGGGAAFLALGVGLPAVALGALLAYFRRRSLL